MFHWFYIHNLQKQANKTKKQFHVILVYVSITISKFQQSPSSDLTTLHVEPTKQLDLFETKFNTIFVSDIRQVSKEGFTRVTFEFSSV